MAWIEQQIAEIVTLNDKFKTAFSALGVDTMDLKPDAKT